MSTRAMAARYSQGGGYNPPSNSLDLFGIRERRANRLADADLERQKVLIEFYNQLQREIATEEAGIKETAAEKENKRKIAEKYGVTAEQYDAIANDVLGNTRGKLAFDTKETGIKTKSLDNPNAQKASDLGIANALAGMSFDKLPTTLRPGESGISLNLPGITAPENTGFGLRTSFGLLPERSEQKQGGYYDFTTGKMIPETESSQTVYKNRPDIIPANPAIRNQILQQSNPAATNVNEPAVVPAPLQTKPDISNTIFGSLNNLTPGLTIPQVTPQVAPQAATPDSGLSTKPDAASIPFGHSAPGDKPFTDVARDFNKLLELFNLYKQNVSTNKYLTGGY